MSKRDIIICIAIVSFRLVGIISIAGIQKALNNPRYAPTQAQPNNVQVVQQESPDPKANFNELRNALMSVQNGGVTDVILDSNNKTIRVYFDESIQYFSREQKRELGNMIQSKWSDGIVRLYDKSGFCFARATSLGVDIYE